MEEIRRDTLNSIRRIKVPRRVLIGLSILAQLVFLGFLVLRFNAFFPYFYAASVVLSLIAFFFVVNSPMNPAYKIAWIIAIMAFPIFGGLVYFIFGRRKMSKKTAVQMRHHEARSREALGTQRWDRDAQAASYLPEQPDAAVQARYIQDYAGYPAYPESTSKTEYLSTGEAKFQRLLEALNRAERFIFLEYFIIQEGIMWNQILEVLKEKAAKGVDVRLIYDDVGCLFTLPHHYDRYLESLGIQCCVFNPLAPVLSKRFNNRDHRKIAIIDGVSAFTGGINLADEYINEYEKYGHWKDTGIHIQGDAVWNFTVMFLAMWDSLRGVEEDFADFRRDRYASGCPDPVPKEPDPVPKEPDPVPKEPDPCVQPRDMGCVQPFADSPLDNEPVGESVYLNLIYKAKRTLYITTPYLIIANELVTALNTAAKGGVDVRIITPFKWDKRLVHIVTQTYYKSLMDSGVRIYEYTPGFMHAKTFVMDDNYGVVGTINLDYRSLYLHFENAVWLHNTASVLAMKEDFLETLKSCREMRYADLADMKWHRKLAGVMLRVFAPML